MKIDYDGRIWDFELEEMSVAECEAVERWVGKGLGEWSNQLAAGSVKSVVALWWVMRSQSGDSPGPISEPGDGFRPVKLLAALTAAVEAEAAAEAEADPTAPAAARESPAG